MSDVAHMLEAIEGGDARAASELLPLVYDELRQLAARRLTREAWPDLAGDRLGPRGLSASGCGATSMVATGSAVMSMPSRWWRRYRRGPACAVCGPEPARGTRRAQGEASRAGIRPLRLLIGLTVEGLPRAHCFERGLRSGDEIAHGRAGRRATEGYRVAQGPTGRAT
jgi:hypothetical protein